MTERRDQTFLFADLAGFTALTEAHGDDEAADMAGDFFNCMRKLLPECAGEEIKTMGDAMMVRCEEPKSAIHLGLVIAEQVGIRSHFPNVSVGMHTGPATHRNGDWFGAAVNLAARVSGLAGGNEVLLTDATRAAAGEIASVQFRHHGRQTFKNVQLSVEVWRAIREGEMSECLPIDPVCRMTVHSGHAKGSLIHRGVEYHFCSLACVQAFAAAPERYVVTG